MSAWLNKTHVGDCRHLMKRMAADGVQVQTCVTSPPYFGLRDYGASGQIGLEPSLYEWIDTMVEVFDAVWDVLADDGTLWLNLGDSYATNGGAGWQGKNGQRADRRFTASLNTVGLREANRRPPTGLKAKDLMGQPWRVAFALQDAGWYLRSDIIWHKPNPMPESCKDRPTKAHEYIFLLSKQPSYYYDADAIKEPASPNTHARMQRSFGGYAPSGQEPHSGIMAPRNGVNPKAANSGKHSKPVGGWAAGAGSHSALDHATKGDQRTKFRVKQNESFAASVSEVLETRNKRSVWSVPTEGFTGAHFATFPQALIRPCILAGAPPGGIVFDPFMGSGTVAQVATDLGRQFIGIELNPDYAGMGETCRKTTIGFPI